MNRKREFWGPASSEAPCHIWVSVVTTILGSMAAGMAARKKPWRGKPATIKEDL